MRYDDPELRERLAAEYVLGTMPTRSRRRLEQLIARDRALAQAIGAWADLLAPIDTAMPTEQPPARVWRGIEARIAAPAPAAAPAAAGWLGSLAFWRGLAIAGCAAAAALVIYIAVFAGRIGPPAPIVVAVLADQNGDPSWIATAGPQKGEVSISAVGSRAQDTSHSLELWGITGGTPRPLGLLSQQPSAGAIVRDAQVPPPGDLLAVSLEPPGGSPTGLPTGPVLSKGKVLIRTP
jgi:anti-sigma-K factor RskA